MVLVADAPDTRDAAIRRRSAAPPRRVPRVVCWPPGAQAIVELPAGGCRWPLGEVADEGFAFCGAPRERGSYCAGHRALSRAGGRRPCL